MVNGGRREGRHVDSLQAIDSMIQLKSHKLARLQKSKFAKLCSLRSLEAGAEIDSVAMCRSRIPYGSSFVRGLR